MGLADRLYDRYDFYKGAYNETIKERKKSEKELIKLEGMLNTEAFNIFNEIIDKVLSVVIKNQLETDYKINIDDIEAEFSEVKKRKENEIEKLKEDDRYIEYLQLIINNDLNMVMDLEKNEIFQYLIKENFHNDNFYNEPYISIWKFEYQPRYWKFKKAANELAKSFGIINHETMFKVWGDLRSAYRSLIGDKRVIDVIEECKDIDNKIKKLEQEIIDLPSLYRKDVILRLVEVIKVTEIRDYRFSNLIPIKAEYVAIKGGLQKLSDRENAIMENLSSVEKIILATEKGAIFDESKFSKFFENTDPTTPVFELIPEVEWDDIREAFEKAGIKLGDRRNYSVVKTELSKEQEDYYLKKYNVKEGEIFFDKDLQ